MSNNRHRHQRTPADVRGRCRQVRPSKSGGRPHRALASGRRGRRFKSGHPDQLKAAPLRGAAGSASAPRSALGGPRGARPAAAAGFPPDHPSSLTSQAGCVLLAVRSLQADTGGSAVSYRPVVRGIPCPDCSDKFLHQRFISVPVRDNVKSWGICGMCGFVGSEN